MLFLQLNYFFWFYRELDTQADPLRLERYIHFLNFYFTYTNFTNE